ncbi:hypothetical protein Saa2_01079 [Streptomyces acidiscabies]|nr:hypothetical protein Saa2_01079 [Streptomyces acidiscabies]
MSGTWASPYDDKVLTTASQADIDHMVPLAAAWRSGADTWTTERRRAFANDLEHSQLIAVSAASNRAKGDKTPDAWRPPSTAYWCIYSRAWTHIKSLYGLTVTSPEKTAIGEMLALSAHTSGTRNSGCLFSGGTSAVSLSAEQVLHLHLPAGNRSHPRLLIQWAILMGVGLPVLASGSASRPDNCPTPREPVP